ncbi:uncharacterized protein [Euphorbia lathyris]|uniref:uncharacterized protein n=1 Tax=Euphorbia lathyris TaxID=212925 RepID=UPI003313C7B2
MEGGTDEPVQENPEKRRRRGSTRGAKWKKMRDLKKGPIVVDIPLCLHRAVGKNAQQFITETSYMVKQHLSLNVKNWASIDKDVKEKKCMYYRMRHMSIMLFGLC